MADEMPVPDAKTKQLLLENRREFLSFLERRLGRRDLAEDILQDAFARGFEKLETLRDGEAAIAWFYRVLRNATIDHYRRTKSADQALARFARELESAEQPPESLRGEVCACVARLAETLKPEYAEALRRIEVDGVSVASFAEEKQISKSNAGVRVFRARDALRRQVALTCGMCAEHGCLECTCQAREGDRASRSCGH
ncbi:MAG TPA: sigma-70 family RNA polymerase sigma factor [Polyangiaceae bacterium]|nr:sigma-70 family RNA polymerase sigma factor [Polyangiaceae bacterium]